MDDQNQKHLELKRDKAKQGSKKSNHEQKSCQQTSLDLSSFQDDQNTSILDVSTTQLRPSEIPSLNPFEKYDYKPRNLNSKEDPFGQIDTSQVNFEKIQGNMHNSFEPDHSNYSENQHSQFQQQTGNGIAETMDGNQTLPFSSKFLERNQHTAKYNPKDIDFQPHSTSQPHFQEKDFQSKKGIKPNQIFFSQNTTAKTNKIQPYTKQYTRSAVLEESKERRDEDQNQNFQEEYLNTDDQMDTASKHMIDKCPTPDAKNQNSASALQIQNMEIQRQKTLMQRRKTIEITQKFLGGMLKGLNPNQFERDKEIFESNPHVMMAKNLTILTKIQLTDDNRLTTPELEKQKRKEEKKRKKEEEKQAKKMKRKETVGEKLFGDLKKNHQKKQGFKVKIAKCIKCFWICKSKKKVEQSKDLLDALKEMTMKYRKKQERTEQLWRKVRALVRTGIFIKAVKSSTNQRLRKSQIGVSERKQIIIERSISLLKMQNNRYLCFIKANSTFAVIWEFVIAVVFIITFWIIPINIATLFQPYQSLQSFEILIDFVILIDIMMNFVTEGTTPEGDTIIYLKDQSKNYLKTYFFVDLFSVTPLFLAWESNNRLYYFKLLRFIRIKRFFMFFKYLQNIFNQLFHDSNKRPKVKRYIELFKIVMIYYFIFHLHSCMWHYLGITNQMINQQYNLHESQLYPNSGNLTRGWISLVLNNTIDYEYYAYLEIYLRAQYFIVTSFSTVGYGDIHSTDENEYFLVIYYLMSGQLLFSFFTGKLKAAMLKVDNLELISIKADIIETVELFLMKFGRIRGARTLKNKEIKNVLEHVDASFQYNFRSIKKEKYYRLLTPKLQRKLVFHLFGHYQNKFLYFFEDFDSKYKAGDNFIFEVLSNLQCVILTPGQIVIDTLQNFPHLYFIVHGSVNLFDKFQNFIVTYVPGANFGDFQVILGLKSQYCYRGTVERTSYLLSLDKEVFLKALSQDYDAFCYLTKIALRRRKDLRQIAEDAREKQLEINSHRLRMEREASKILTLAYDSPKSVKGNLKVASQSHSNHIVVEEIDSKRLSQREAQREKMIQSEGMKQDSQENDSFGDKVDNLLRVPSSNAKRQKSFLRPSSRISSGTSNNYNLSMIQGTRKLKILQLLQIRCQMQNNRFINYFLENLNLNSHVSKTGKFDENDRRIASRATTSQGRTRRENSLQRQSSSARRSKRNHSSSARRGEDSSMSRAQKRGKGGLVGTSNSDDELIIPHNKSSFNSNSSGSETDSFTRSDCDVLNSDDEVSHEEEDEYTLPDGYKFYAERIGEADNAYKKLKQIIKSGKKKFGHILQNLSTMDKQSLQNARDTINLEKFIYERIDSLISGSEGTKSLMKKVTLNRFGGIIHQITGDKLSSQRQNRQQTSNGQDKTTSTQNGKVIISDSESSFMSDDSVSSKTDQVKSSRNPSAQKLNSALRRVETVKSHRTKEKSARNQIQDYSQIVEEESQEEEKESSQMRENNEGLLQKSSLINHPHIKTEAQYISLIQSPMLSPDRQVQDYSDQGSIRKGITLQKRNRINSEHDGDREKVDAYHLDDEGESLDERKLLQFQSNYESKPVLRQFQDHQQVPFYNFESSSIQSPLPYSQDNKSPLNGSPIVQNKGLRKRSSSSSIRGNISSITEQTASFQNRGPRRKIGEVVGNQASYYSRQDLQGSISPIERSSNQFASRNDKNTIQSSFKSKAQSSLNVVRGIAQDGGLSMNLTPSQNKLVPESQEILPRSPAKRQGAPVETSSVEKFEQQEEFEMRGNFDQEQSQSINNYDFSSYQQLRTEEEKNMTDSPSSQPSTQQLQPPQRQVPMLQLKRTPKQMLSLKIDPTRFQISEEEDEQSIDKFDSTNRMTGRNEPDEQGIGSKGATQRKKTDKSNSGVQKTNRRMESSGRLEILSHRKQTEDMRMQKVSIEVMQLQDSSRVDTNNEPNSKMRESSRKRSSLVNLNSILEEAKDLLGTEMQSSFQYQSSSRGPLSRMDTITATQQRRVKELQEEDMILEEEDFQMEIQGLNFDKIMDRERAKKKMSEQVEEVKKQGSNLLEKQNTDMNHMTTLDQYGLEVFSKDEELKGKPRKGSSQFRKNSNAKSNFGEGAASKFNYSSYLKN